MPTPEEIQASIQLFTDDVERFNDMLLGDDDTDVEMSDASFRASIAKQVKQRVDETAAPIIHVVYLDSIAAIESQPIPDYERVVYLNQGAASGMFVWNDSNLSTEVTNDQPQGIYIAPDDDDTGASGAWVRVIDGHVTPEMYGALLNGSDETDILLAMIKTGLPIWVHTGTLGVLSIDTSLPIRLHVDANAALKCLDQGVVGPDYQTIKTKGDHSRIVIDGLLDCNDTGITAFVMEADDCFFYCRKAIDLSIKTGSALNVSVLRAVGNNNVFSGYGENFPRNGISSGTIPSAPRLFSVEGTSDNYYCPFAITDGATCTVVVGAPTIAGRIDLIKAARGNDNTLYLLGGSLTVGDIIHEYCEDETVVNKGNLTVTGCIYVRGYTISCIGLDNAGDTFINAIDWDDQGLRNTAGDYSGNIWRMRSGNTLSGSLTIGTIRAIYEGNNLWAGGNGDMGRFTLGKSDILYKYREDNADTNINGFGKLENVASFNISDVVLRIEDTDGVLTSSNRFELNNADPVDAMSFLHNFKMYPTNPDGSIADHQIRWRQAAQELIHTTGANWTNAVSPPAIDQSSANDNPNFDTIDSYPTSGTWTTGKFLMNNNIGGTGSTTTRVWGWECISGGAPGQWVSLSLSVITVP